MRTGFKVMFILYCIFLDNNLRKNSKTMINKIKKNAEIYILAVSFWFLYSLLKGCLTFHKVLQFLEVRFNK